MNRFRSWIQSALDAFHATRLSRRALRTITQQLDLQLGCRVLVAGREPLELARYFARLGSTTTAFMQNGRRRPARIPADQPITCSFGDAQVAVPFPPRCFDAVILTDESAFGGNGNGPLSSAATANLLGCLKPGGRLGVIQNNLSETSAKAHRPECIEHLFAAFQLETNIISLAAKPRNRGSRSSGAVLLTVDVEPDHSRSRVDWLQSAVSPPINEKCCPLCRVERKNELPAAA